LNLIYKRKMERSYTKTLSEERHKQQMNELNQVISKIRTLRTDDRGGAEVEELRGELEETQRQIKECEILSEKLGKELDKERDKNDELENRIELLSLGPATLSIKKIKTGEDATDNENLKKCKEQLRSCLESDIPPNMSLARLHVINEYLDDNIGIDAKPEMGNLLTKYKKIEEKLQLLKEYYPNEYEEEEIVDTIKRNALTFLYEDIRQEISEVNQGKIKLMVLNQVSVILQRNISRLDPELYKKKRQFDETKCLVCGKVGVRLCEETSPHRVFCGLVCQSKFYYQFE
jgi:flagellar biosynthesis chaperone FliJ